MRRRFSNSVSHQTILVLDFGSQYTQLIARRLRELSVYSEIVPFNTPLEALRAKQPGRHHPVGRAEERVRGRRAEVRRRRSFDLGVPVLGICYGMQLMTDMLGGEGAPVGAPRVRPRARAGAATNGARRRGCSPGCRPSSASGPATATTSPRCRPGFRVAATSATAPIVAMEAPDRALYALLFHPEVVHTDHGTEILRNFAFDVCGCTGDWTIASFIEEATERIRQQVGRPARSSAGCRAASIRPSRRC